MKHKEDCLHWEVCKEKGGCGYYDYKDTTVDECPHFKQFGTLTNFQLIKSMTIDEMAEKATRQMLVNIRDDCWLSMIDWTCYLTKELAINHNKEFLEAEVK